MSGPERIAEKLADIISIVDCEDDLATIDFSRARAAAIIAAEVAPMVEALRHCSSVLSGIIESGELRRVYSGDRKAQADAIAALAKWDAVEPQKKNACQVIAEFEKKNGEIKL